jgi:hypothetical protein
MALFLSQKYDRNKSLKVQELGNWGLKLESNNIILIINQVF